MTGALTGALVLEAERRGDRTHLTSVRQEGLARVSRAFRFGEAARIVTSLLGPGYVRGDRTSCRGRVGPRAHLVVTAQSATRIYGGDGASHAEALWTVDPGGYVELLADPIAAFAAAAHASRTTIALAPAARLTVVDVYTAIEADFTVLETALEIRCGGVVVFRDRARVTPRSLPARALATFVHVGTLSDSARAAIDGVLVKNEPFVRFGIGAPLVDGILVRAYSDDAWLLRECFHALAEIVRRDARAQKLQRPPTFASLTATSAVSNPEATATCHTLDGR